jgi:hypothetical protein
MSDDKIQQYNQKFIHIQKEYKQICNINDTVDVKTNEINMVKDKLENLLTECSATALEDIIPNN